MLEERKKREKMTIGVTYETDVGEILSKKYYLISTQSHLSIFVIDFQEVQLFIFHSP